MSSTVEVHIFRKGYNISTVYVLFALLLLGAFIRFYNLTYTSLWLDEIYSMKGADVSSSIAEVYEYSKQDQPPLFFILLHLWFEVFGYSDYAGRALTGVFGLLGILAMYFLGTEVKNERVGIYSAFVTTINWFHVGISVEIRFYALVFLLSALSYLFFIKALKQSRISTLALYVLFTSLLLNTHYFGMVLFTTQLLVFITCVIVFGRSIKLVIAIVAAGALAGMSIYHWLPVILHDLQIENFHIKPLTARNILKSFWWYFYDPAAFIIYFAIFLMLLKSIYKNIKLRAIALEDVIIGGWIIIGFAIPLIYSFTKLPLFTNKYCTIQVPAMFLVLGHGLASLPNVRIRQYVTCILLISAAIVLFIARPQFKKSFHEDGREIAIMYFTARDADTKSWNEDWREVAEFFKDQNENNRVIFSQLSWFHEYYFEKYKLTPPLNQNVCDFSSSINGKDSIWLLLHDHYRNGPREIGFSTEQQKIIRENFDLQDHTRFRKSKALLYVRKPAPVYVVGSDLLP